MSVPQQGFRTQALVQENATLRKKVRELEERLHAYEPADGDIFDFDAEHGQNKMPQMGKMRKRRRPRAESSLETAQLRYERQAGDSALQRAIRLSLAEHETDTRVRENKARKPAAPAAAAAAPAAVAAITPAAVAAAALEAPADASAPANPCLAGSYEQDVAGADGEEEVEAAPQPAEADGADVTEAEATQLQLNGGGGADEAEAALPQLVRGETADEAEAEPPQATLTAGAAEEAAAPHWTVASLLTKAIGERDGSAALEDARAAASRSLDLSFLANYEYADEESEKDEDEDEDEEHDDDEVLSEACSVAGCTIAEKLNDLQGLQGMDDDAQSSTSSGAEHGTCQRCFNHSKLLLCRGERKVGDTEGDAHVILLFFIMKFSFLFTKISWTI